MSQAQARARALLLARFTSGSTVIGTLALLKTGATIKLLEQTECRRGQDGLPGHSLGHEYRTPLCLSVCELLVKKIRSRCCPLNLFV
jgi:hypothetical protein